MRLRITYSHFDPKYLDLYWKFVNERHWVWYRRSVLQQPSPWTNDPIIRTEFLNNIYRELDPGTEYALKMLEAEDTPHNKLFNLTLYRLLGSKQEFFDTVGWQKLDSFQPRDFLQTIHSYRNSKGNPFGDAYRVAPYHTMGTSDKFENVTRLLEKLLPDFPGLYDRLLASASAREAYDHFKDTEGFGDFLSYQIVVDCITPLPHGGQLLPFSQDDWAVAGPGAKQGARKLCAADYNPGSYLPMMKWLRDSQADEFARLGLNFPYLKNIDGTIRALSLSNIQSTLCEFNKYSRIYDGASPVRRFYPATRTDQLTRWGAVEHEVPAVSVQAVSAAGTQEPNVVERGATAIPDIKPLANVGSASGDQVIVFVVGVMGQVEQLNQFDWSRLLEPLQRFASDSGQPTGTTSDRPATADYTARITTPAPPLSDDSDQRAGDGPLPVPRGTGRKHPSGVSARLRIRPGSDRMSSASSSFDASGDVSLAGLDLPELSDYDVEPLLEDEPRNQDLSPSEPGVELSEQLDD